MEFFDQLSMPTVLKRRARSNRISLRVNEEGLRINAGKHIPTTEIERFVLKKSTWINKQWRKYELVMNEDGCLHLGELKPQEFFQNNDLEFFEHDNIKNFAYGAQKLKKGKKTLIQHLMLKQSYANRKP